VNKELFDQLKAENHAAQQAKAAKNTKLRTLHNIGAGDPIPKSLREGHMPARKHRHANRFFKSAGRGKKRRLANRDNTD
jgi:hypothetical protein